MKKIFILFCVYVASLLAQQASTYFPASLGHVWYFKTTPLDSVQQPVDSLSFFQIDSLAALSNHQGQAAYHIVGKTGPAPGIFFLPYTDTSWVNFNSTDAKQYFGIANLDSIARLLHSFGLDTLFGGFNLINTIASFQKWYTMFKFASPVNASYTVFQYDTTITIQTQTVPLRFLLKGKRQSDQTTVTPAGTFLCKVFAMEFSINYVVDLPPPLPDIVVPLLTMPDSLFFAPGKWVVKDVMPATKFDLAQFGFGSFNIPGTVSVLVPSIVTSVEESVSAVPGFTLSQNYPNPFNPVTKITFTLEEETNVRLEVLNVNGELVSMLADSRMQAGRHVFEFNAAEQPAGVYFYRLLAGGQAVTRKLLYLK